MKHKRFIYVYECFAQMCVCATCVCLVPMKDRRRHWILWTWSNGLLWAANVDAGNQTSKIKPGSSVKIRSALNY